jgi:hypothetical protein
MLLSDPFFHVIPQQCSQGIYLIRFLPGHGTREIVVTDVALFAKGIEVSIFFRSVAVVTSKDWITR